ncbi:MAG: ATP-binding protein [Pseudomonadota bacterium]
MGRVWRAIEEWRIAETDLVVGTGQIKQEYAGWRMTALMLTVLIIALNFGEAFSVIWVAAYAFCDYLDRRFSAELAATRTASAYFRSQIVFTSALVVFRSMVVYLCLHEHPHSNYLALVVMLVATRSSGTPLHRVSSRVIISAIADIATLLFLAIIFFYYSPQIADAIYVGIALVGLAVYYVISTIQSVENLHSIERLEQLTRQSQKMEAVGRLTGGVAHDFNNILTVILGNIDLARETKLNPEADDLLDKTSVAASRAAELTSQLLAFSRQSPLVLREHNLGHLLTRSIGLAERLLPANVKIEVATVSDLWAIKTDAVQLETALLNLVTNARDAMPRGGLITINAQNIRVDAKRDDLAPGLFVHLDIKDEGNGIPKTEIDQVTEPFFTTKPVGQGSGLGLSMVKGFVEQTGGALAIQSVPGTSTTVTLTLPAAEPISPSPSGNTDL